MNNNELPKDSIEKLYWLIDQVIEKKITLSSFSRNYEYILNEEVDKSLLSKREEKIFEDLMYYSALYVPDPEKRKEDRSYLDEDGYFNKIHSLFKKLEKESVGSKKSSERKGDGSN